MDESQGRRLLETFEQREKRLQWFHEELLKREEAGYRIGVDVARDGFRMRTTMLVILAFVLGLVIGAAASL